MDRNDPAYKGQADYSRLLLNVYDPIVIGFVSWFVWHCPADPILDGTGSTSATTTWTSALAPATASINPACPMAVVSPSSTQTPMSRRR